MQFLSWMTPVLFIIALLVMLLINILLIIVIKNLYKKNVLLENKIWLSINLINSEISELYTIDGMNEYLNDINFKSIIHKIVLIKNNLNNIVFGNQSNT